MQGDALPTSLPSRPRHLGKACALITDGRFSGGTSGLSIGHVSPRGRGRGRQYRAGVRDGDTIDIDIPRPEHSPGG